MEASNKSNIFLKCAWNVGPLSTFKISYLILLSLHSTPIQEPIFDGASGLAHGWVSEFKEGATARGLWGTRGTADQAKRLVGGRRQATSGKEVNV